ncbi:MAG: sulfurtransferase [Pirellulaceae bacterium]
MNPSPLVSVPWLEQNLNQPNLVILDATIPKIGQIGTHRLAGLRIPEAQFFDLNGKFSDPNTDLPHNLPTPDAFTAASRELGVSDSSHIIVYDQHGIYSSPRAWWMFRAMGHTAVSVLDGGLPKWIEAGMPVEAAPAEPPVPGDFVAKFQPQRVAGAEQLLKNIESAESIVIDARSAGRFCGAEPEPRAGLTSGHIPNSLNLPFDQVLRDGQFLPRAELSQRIKKLNLTDAPLVFSCGSGLTACITLLACELVLPNATSIYDGSWAEWGQPEKRLPIATTAARGEA